MKVTSGTASNGALLGEVPIRDFMAYDLGRYYWSAAIMGLMGDNGIMALRLTTSIFAGLGIFLALVLIARSSREDDILVMLPAAGILILWMFQPHRIFDITTSIALVGALAYPDRTALTSPLFCQWIGPRACRSGRT